MKRISTICIALLAAVVLFTQCKPIDLTADYKDITISYGFLNAKENVHYFKIYRGYITDGNAYDAAAEWDNIYYPVDSIEVRLVEYRNGQVLRSAVLDALAHDPVPVWAVGAEDRFGEVGKLPYLKEALGLNAAHVAAVVRAAVQHK